MARYDYLVVGSGLSGAVFACEAMRRGKSCLVLERRDHIGGNLYDEDQGGILVQCYGAHIFHTDSREIWDYFQAICPFRPFINTPVANYNGEIYNLPFNLNTFSRLWGTVTPWQAKERLERERVRLEREPQNLEEQALSLVGREIYEKLVKGYTEKQWGRSCRELPAFLIKRLPVRFTYNNNYFNDFYQGIPDKGYTYIIAHLLEGSEVKLGVDYNKNREYYRPMAEYLVYTGMLDEYFDYCLGPLEYRTLRFEHFRYQEENHQGVAVMNYTDRETPYTRSIEHKHFYGGGGSDTVVTKEYPQSWKPGLEPYYPVNDPKNQALYEQYAALAAGEKKTLFLGRLARYHYYDMDKAAAAALQAVRIHFGR